MSPDLTPIKGGWAAVGQGWAVFGSTRDEALARFEEAEARHETMRQREARDRTDVSDAERPSGQSRSDGRGRVRRGDGFRR